MGALTNAIHMITSQLLTYCFTGSWHSNKRRNSLYEPKLYWFSVSTDKGTPMAQGMLSVTFREQLWGGFFFLISFSHAAKILGILLRWKSWWSLKHHNFPCIIWFTADFHSIFRCFRFSTRGCLQKQLILHHGCCSTHQVSVVQRWV